MGALHLFHWENGVCWIGFTPATLGKWMLINAHQPARLHKCVRVLSLSVRDPKPWKSAYMSMKQIDISASFAEKNENCRHSGGLITGDDIVYHVCCGPDCLPACGFNSQSVALAVCPMVCPCRLSSGFSPYSNTADTWHHAKLAVCEWEEGSCVEYISYLGLYVTAAFLHRGISST